MYISGEKKCVRERKLYPFHFYHSQQATYVIRVSVNPA
jgi:hypothetical protein